MPVNGLPSKPFHHQKTGKEEKCVCSVDCLLLEGVIISLTVGEVEFMTICL